MKNRRRACVACSPRRRQITPGDQAAGDGTLDLEQVAARLAPHGEFTHNGYLLHGRFGPQVGQGSAPVELTLFPDGRAIIKGTTEQETARSIYARYVGS